MATKIKWLDRPAEKDFGAAARYLGLLLPQARADALGQAFSDGAVTMHRANDLLRASGLPLLGSDDPSVRKDLKKVQRGESISPVLVVRGDLDKPRSMIIADGYHRICASYELDEDLMIPCVIIDSRATPARATKAAPA